MARSFPETGAPAQLGTASEETDSAAPGQASRSQPPSRGRRGATDSPFTLTPASRAPRRAFLSVVSFTLHRPEPPPSSPAHPRGRESDREAHRRPQRTRERPDWHQPPPDALPTRRQSLTGTHRERVERERERVLDWGHLYRKRTGETNQLMARFTTCPDRWQ